ncbi:hypothetical protein BDV06DRAFT_224865 [Aspergillus oleicola]
MHFSINILTLTLAALATMTAAAPESSEVEVCLKICYPEETPCPAPSYPKQQGAVSAH